MACPSLPRFLFGCDGDVGTHGTRTVLCGTVAFLHRLVSISIIINAMRHENECTSSIRTACMERIGIFLCSNL